MCNYQSWFRVNQRWISAVQRWKSYVSELKKISAEQRWFRAVCLWNSAVQLWNSAEFFSSEQRWFRENQSWSARKQSWSALMFIMFSESALKNVKSMKQRCSSLITSGTSTLDSIDLIQEKNYLTQFLLYSRELYYFWLPKKYLKLKYHLRRVKKISLETEIRTQRCSRKISLLLDG